MSTIPLTETQHAVLTRAIDHTDGRVEWFPENLHGGARNRVLTGLTHRGLAVLEAGAWRATPAAYAALGREAPAPGPVVQKPEPNASEATQAPPEALPADPTEGVQILEVLPVDPDLEADVAAAEATFASPAETPRHPRENTKQATVIAMLRRPEGATIAQIQAATQWQAHTVRGHFAGSLRKKLGLTLVSEKVQGQDRVYRIADK